MLVQLRSISAGATALSEAKAPGAGSNRGHLTVVNSSANYAMKMKNNLPAIQKLF